MRRFGKPFAVFNEVTLSSSALLNNFDFFSSLIPKGYVIPVLKSNAYGHGITEVATILKQRNMPYVAVDGFYESIAIHKVSNQPVLVMGAIKPENFHGMRFKGLAFAVHDPITVKALAETGRKVKIHIEIDTGMTRHGVSVMDLPYFLDLLSRYPKIVVEGVMSHLADADNPNNDSYTIKQSKIFDDAVNLILKAGFKPRYIHIAQSAGSTKVISKYANTLRVGLAIYGLNPLNELDKAHKQLDSLVPVLSLTSTITKVIFIKKGTSVSYGRTFTANRNMRIGVLPLGYYEGIPRVLSNIGSVQYGNRYLPITGRVCMNHTMIDLGDADIGAGDQVTIFSNDIKSENTIDKICSRYDLFNYSLLVGITQNIRRRIVD